MQIDIQNFARNLILDKSKDIWYAQDKSQISYPEEGNDWCFQIEENSFWFNHRNNCIISTVKNFCPDKTFFDIGGGNGFVAKGLEKAGIKSVLVEPGAKGAQNAKRRGLKNIICSTLEDADFKSSSIPVAGLFDVVEHIEDDVAFLSNIHKVIEPGGFVFITVPAYQMLWSVDDEYAGHFRRYTTASLGKKLKKIGFKMTYSSYIFSILPFPIFLFRTIPSLFKSKENSTDLNDLERHKDDHKPNEGILTKILNKVWKKELSHIQNKKSLPFGGSCFVVAKKV